MYHLLSRRYSTFSSLEKALPCPVENFFFSDPTVPKEWVRRHLPGTFIRMRNDWGPKGLAYLEEKRDKGANRKSTRDFILPGFS